jgi:phosphatidylglycerophosphatase C
MVGEISTSNRKVIAAFDFDGTITTTDSLLVFIKYAVALPRLITGTILMIPSLVLFKLKFIPNFKAKERLFKIFFGGIGIDEFNQLSNQFSDKIDKIINPAALEKLKWHQQMGHEVIIISASAENWIYPWAIRQGITMVLGTQLEVKNNLITGTFLTKNCHGAEKVNRLLDCYPNREEYTLYAYGDSNGDTELLALADHSFYRSF